MGDTSAEGELGGFGIFKLYEIDGIKILY